MLNTEKSLLAFILLTLSVSIMLIAPLSSAQVRGGPPPNPCAGSQNCPGYSIAGRVVAGHTIRAGCCFPSCGLTCGTGGPTDSGTASSLACTGSFVGGGTYSSSQITYCNGGYENEYGMSLPSGSYASYTCTDTPASASDASGGSGYYDQGSCSIVDYNTTTTHYDPYALGGTLSVQQQSPASAISMVSNLSKDNAANALWLVSCPTGPTSDPTDYFSQKLASFIGGNMCLANDAPLTSGAKVTTQVTWTPEAPITGILDNLTFTNLAQGQIYNLAYANETNTIGSQTFDISNGYNTSSLVYQQVPGAVQSGVWGWYAKRADVSGFSPQVLSQWQGAQTGGGYSSQSYTGGSSFSFIQNFDQKDGGTEYKWTCSYSYSFSTDMQIQSIQNANIPLASSGGEPVGVLPYYLYNISIPSTTSELNYVPSNAVLNLSLDLYSPHNFQSSQAQSLDPFPFYTDSGFLAGTGSGSQQGDSLASFSPGLMGVHSQQSSDLSSPSTALGQLPTTTFLSGMLPSATQPFLFDTKGATAGVYAEGQLQGPTYIAASPDDFVYVLGSTSLCGWLCFSSTSSVNLYVMRFVPRGDYNLSNYQPGSVPFTASDPASSSMTWNDEWGGSSGYWANSLLQQSQNLYLTNIYQLNSKTSSFWGADAGTPAGQAAQMLPTAVATDYNNDLFVLGANTVQHELINGFAFNSFMFSAIYANGTVQTPITVNAMDNNFTPSDEFAASPGGQFLYFANVSYPGNVEIFSSAGYTNPDGTQGLQNIGTIPLSFSTRQYTMNITAYLAHGGPYLDPSIAAAYKGQSTVLDMASNHRPIAISDSKGIIYVLDNWTFNVGGMQSSELLLRAFSYNGLELPIEYGTFNTITPTSQYIYAGNIGSGQMPPYGWVLAANISVGGSTTVSYCAMGCLEGPGSQQLSASSYQPVGPMIKSTGSVGPTAQDISMTTDFNGTSYIIAHDYAVAPSDFLSQIWSALFGSNPSQLYTELLVFRPSLVNYTTQSFGAKTPYVCYTDYSAGQTPCAYSSSVSQLYPPLMGIPSSFYYLESQGSPQQYLSLQNIVSSLFPNGALCQGAQSQSKQCQAQATAQSNIKSNESKIEGILSGAAASGLAPPVQPNTYVNSVITGYVLIPYKITYSLSSGISPTKNGVDLNGQTAMQGTVIAGNPPGGGPPGGYYHCVAYRSSPRGGPETCSDWEPACTYPIPSTLIGSQAQGSDLVQYAYGRVNLPESKPLNETVEGGGTYLQLQPSGSYYIANISDAGMITIPRVDAQMFTNRLFGAVYVNSTIRPGASGYSPQGYTSPLVVNAVQALNYQENFYVQQGTNGEIYPGYSTQQSMPPSSEAPVVGPYCGSSCPKQYYYSTNPSQVFQGQSEMSYSGYPQINYVSLFSTIAQASQAYSTTLSIPETSILGYNRLIYTLIDRFNNKIFVPLGVDFANIAQITLYPSESVSATNANETTVRFNGTATFTNSTGTYPLPAGSNIYLYYDTNINYFNATSGPASSPASYFKWALQCDFGIQNSAGCPYANPLATLPATQGPAGPQIAGAVTFHTDYGSKPNECIAEPKSLISQAPAYNCNIYGSDNLPATSYDSNIQAYDYCDPQDSSGDGYLTPQFGLVAVVQTDSGGNFNYSFNVCGTGSHRLIASYYGSPGPQPFQITQTPLGQSSGAYEFFSSSTSPAPLTGQNLEYGYVYAPNTVAAGVQIGSYALGFGSVGITALVALAAAILLITAMRARAAKPRRAGRTSRRRLSR